MEPETLNLPVLALRGLTVFPHTNLTFDVERRISMKALEVAMETGQEIFLVTQREINVDKPTEQDLYTMGTISRVTQILRLGQNSLRVMVEGGRRARLKRLWQLEPVPGLRPAGRECGGGGHRRGSGLPGSRLPGGPHCPEYRPAVR